MKKLHFQVMNKLSIFLIGFQNINMYSKGTYLVRLQASIADQKCFISRSNQQNQRDCLVLKSPTQQFSKNFMIKYQNEKVDINELFSLEGPLFKYSKESNIAVRITLLKVEREEKPIEKVEYVRVASTVLTIRFTLNSIFEYSECIFQEPFLSSLSLLIFNQPTRVVIQTKNYKHSGEEEIMMLKKEVKRLRYNNYLMQSKFKKFIYNDIKYSFTLPKMFVTGGMEMTEVESSQEKFLNYLILYETTPFTPEIMNYELTSIGLKNEELLEIFKNSCANGTIFINKLKMEWEEKECKKFRQYISKEEHKLKFCEEYKTIIRDKLKILEKEYQLMNNDETLNNIVMRHERGHAEQSSSSLPVYPIVIHQVERLKTLEKTAGLDDKDQHKTKTRYIFILAHGYQGCSDDLVYIANGLKKRYRRSKYLILKSFQGMMDQSLVEMSKTAEEEVNDYLKTFNFAEKEYKIVMIGHSMGGLILRSIAAKICFPQHLYGFVSLGTPHLGYLQGIKFFIKAGISLLSNISHCPCLSELSSKDNNNLHECLIYKLSHSAPLSNFKKIVLLSSVHDKYVSWHSARLQNYSKDAVKQYNFIQREMIQNILGKQNRIERIDRIQVEFKTIEKYTACLFSNMDKIIGRSSHIKFLNDHSFLQLFINGCLASILED